MRLGYLYSRYPVLSQTFCDTEMLELERRGWSLVIGSIHPPLTSLRHAHAARLRASVLYAPPAPVLRAWEKRTRGENRWPSELIARHERQYGPQFKPALRARNASYFAHLFVAEGIRHFHVHFANRAAHTALFLREISGIPFSITAHGQDFMSDLGNDDLLREICDAAEFVGVETEYSRRLMMERCPQSSAKIHRVYNGMDTGNFAPRVAPAPGRDRVKILSVGRLVAFKGFEHLIDACAALKERGRAFTCEIIGDGPYRQRLQKQIDEQQLGDVVLLAGARPQQEIFERLKSADIFALASVVDSAGASDVFPTVILEAMASALPVVSTELAGIPEAVADGTTGFLVRPGNSDAFAAALERLIDDAALRAAFGASGRERVEREFQVKTTVEPLVRLLEEQPALKEPGSGSIAAPAQGSEVAYLIRRWPDAALPLLKEELREMKERGVAIIPFVCEAADSGADDDRLATHLTFLPDPLVIEAEWQAHRDIAHALEEDRAGDQQRAPSALFLEQARFAVVLMQMFRDRNIAHVHATDSRMVLCALMLKRALGVTASAAVEQRPVPGSGSLNASLRKLDGGRVAYRFPPNQAGSVFLVEPASFRSGLRGAVARAAEGMGLNMGGRATLWQEWSTFLMRMEVNR